MMRQETLDVLRHVHVHGSRTRAEVVKAFANVPTAGTAVSNLAMLGYLASDGMSTPQTFIVTRKGQGKLAQVAAQFGLKAAPQHAPAAAPAPRLRKPRDARPVSPLAPMARAASGRQYLPHELGPCTRPGSMRAFDLPSRMGDVLRYRDGRITDLDGNPVTE